MDACADRQLVERFREGDESAFVELVRTYHPSLQAQARRRLRAFSDADDAVQETFLRAYRALDRFGGDYQLRAWLGRILSNICTDVASRHHAESRLRERLAGQRHVVADVDEAIDDDGISQAVRGALASLPSSHRQAFLLRDLENRPYSEVASVMAITEVNARARVHRARSTLKRSLRGVSGVLGTVVLPVRVLVAPVLGHGWRSGRLSTLAASGSEGMSVPSSVPQMTGQVPFVAAQIAAAPIAQAAAVALPDVARASLPAAGALMTLAAGALAAVAPAGVATAVPASVAAVYSVSAPVAVAPGAQGDLEVSLASSATPEAVTGAATGSEATPTTATASTTQWAWVRAAAESSSSTAVSDSSSSSSGDPAAPTTATSNAPSSDATSGPAVPDSAAPCPWLAAIPRAGAAPITPAGPLGDTVGYAETFVMSDVALTTTEPSFVGASTGTLNDQNGNALPLQASFSACIPGTTSPMLVVDLTDPGTPQAAEVQLRGTMVYSSSGAGETDVFYRGVADLLGSDDTTDSSAVPFVADLSLLEPANTVTLEIALFGDLPAFGDFTPASSSEFASSAPGSTSSSSAAATADLTPTSDSTGTSNTDTVNTTDGPGTNTSTAYPTTTSESTGTSNSGPTDTTDGPGTNTSTADPTTTSESTGNTDTSASGGPAGDGSSGDEPSS